jgi:hypothetical protein
VIYNLESTRSKVHSQYLPALDFFQVLYLLEPLQNLLLRLVARLAAWFGLGFSGKVGSVFKAFPIMHELFLGVEFFGRQSVLSFLLGLLAIFFLTPFPLVNEISRIKFIVIIL